MALLVVRMRGTINIPYWAATTLQNLYLKRKFTATLVPETTNYLGMLMKVNQWVAWSKVDPELVKTLIEKRGRMKVNKLGSKKEGNSLDEHKGIDELVISIVNDEIKFSDQNNVKPWFSLNPPKGGFKKSTKKQFSDGGILGNNKELLDIVRRMI